MEAYRETAPRYHVLIDEAELIVLVRALKLCETVNKHLYQGTCPDWLRGYAPPTNGVERIRTGLEEVHG